LYVREECLECQFKIRHGDKDGKCFDLTEEFEVIFAMLQLIEADVCLDGDTRTRITEIRVVAGDYCKSFALRFPGKVGYGVFQFNNFHRIILLTHAENFQITKDRLLCLRMAIHLDAEKVALILPIKLTLHGISIGFRPHV